MGPESFTFLSECGRVCDDLHQQLEEDYWYCDLGGSHAQVSAVDKTGIWGQQLVRLVVTGSVHIQRDMIYTPTVIPPSCSARDRCRLKALLLCLCPCSECLSVICVA